MTQIDTPSDDRFDEILRHRRSSREFATTPLSEEEIRHLAWAAQGVTDAEGRRTAPSPGATYGLAVYAVTPDGVLQYDPASDSLSIVAPGDQRRALRRASGGQDAIGAAPVTVVLTGTPRFAATVAPERARRYLLLEAGHAGQNLLLEAVALGLVGVPMASFDEAAVQAALSLPVDHAPLELISVGHARA